MNEDKKRQIKFLKEKGWNDKEIKQAARILHKEVDHETHLSKIIFYSAVLLTIFINLIISFGLMFLSIVFSPIILYLLVSLFGVGIGFLYNFLIIDLGYLDKKHHNLALVLIPFIALFNIVIVVVIANKLIEDLMIQNIQHNPFVVAILFGFFLVLPSIVKKYFKK